jgi:hypothetical protein
MYLSWSAVQRTISSHLQIHKGVPKWHRGAWTEVMSVMYVMYLTRYRTYKIALSPQGASDRSTPVTRSLYILFFKKRRHLGFGVFIVIWSMIKRDDHVPDKRLFQRQRGALLIEFREFRYSDITIANSLRKIIGILDYCT